MAFYWRSMLYFGTDILCIQEGAVFSFYLASFCAVREHITFLWDAALLNLKIKIISRLVVVNSGKTSGLFSIEQKLYRRVQG